MLEPAVSVHVWGNQDRALGGTTRAEQGESGT